MSTFVDGIGQCQVLDKSGELVDLKGHDITSLDKSGTITWEHKSDSPAALVGKILKAKKIFSKEDCENERQLYFWNKCKTPYLYVMGELLDDYTASAKECAGQMKYSRDNPDKAPLLGFSIEGSELPGTRKGPIITRSIGRKITLTQSPCNSACIAEIYEVPEQKSQVKDDFDSIFKSSEEAITLFKSGEGEKIYTDFLAKKEPTPPAVGGKPPKSPYNEYENQGTRIGTTKSGQHVFSHGHIGAYSFNPAEHKEAAEHHRRAAVTADNPKLADNHIQRMAQHNNAAISGGRQENRAALSLKQKDKVSEEQGKQQMQKSEMPNWSAGKADKKQEAVHYSHPEHGVVSIHKQPSGEFHVKHQGKLAGVGGAKGVFSNAKDAGAHAKKYMTAVSQKKILAPKMQNISSDSLMGKVGKAETLNKAQVPGSKYPPKAQVSPTSVKTTSAPPKFGSIPKPTPSAVAKSEGKLCDLHKARVDEGKDPRTKAWDRSGRNHRTGTQTTTWTKPPGVIGRALGKKPTKETHVHQRSHPAAGSSSQRVGSQSDPGYAPKTSAHDGGTVTTDRKVVGTPAKSMKRSESEGDLKKAIEAGSYNAAPSTLTNGAAYQRESLSSSQATTGAEEGQFQATKKKDWNKRAKDDYERWPDREKFEKFMSARMPHLKMGEIKAIGRVISLQKSLNFEKSLENLVSFSKSELDEKSLKDIQKETAEKWADRAEDAYGKAIKEKSIKWLLDADEYFHESIEHSSLSEDLSTFEKIRAKLMPIRKEAFKLLAPGADS
jgi:hypothetical protein